MSGNRLKISTLARLALALCVLVPAIGCASAGKSVDRIAPTINATITVEPPLVLVAGDVLLVEFPQLTEYTHTTRIDRDGSATFRRLGRRACVGLSLIALEQQLALDYMKVFDQPELTVQVQTPASSTVMLIGEVQNTGAQDIPARGLTLLKAIALAGGPKRESASIKNVLLVRWVAASNTRHVWCIDIRPGQWSSNERIFIAPGDIIAIPPKPIVRVNDWVDRYVRRMLPIGITTTTL